MASQIWEAARRYLAAGFSVIPCKYKKPRVESWQKYSVQPPTLRDINRWFEDYEAGQSIGVVLGQVSHNVVVVDLDGMGAARLYKARFPHLLETRIVMSGSLTGFHLYYRVAEMPINLNVRVPEFGGFELRGNGQYVIAPPSPHLSGHFYKVHKDMFIMNIESLNEVVYWLTEMRENVQAGRQEEIKQAAKPMNLKATARKQEFLNKVTSEEIARVYTAQEGNRNNSLFYAGLRLANLAAAGELDWTFCEEMLLTAARNVHMPEMEAQRTIASSWRIGSKYPRKVK
jgi:hypothetical protein